MIVPPLLFSVAAVRLTLHKLPPPLCAMSSLSSSTTVYVISGTSRGIGLGLVEQLVSRPDTFIYAGARNVSKAEKLQQLAKQHSNLRVVKLNAESDEDHAALSRQLEAEAGRVDVLIPNAAMVVYEKTGEISLHNVRSQFEVNFLGPLRLFQSLLPLLIRSSNPRFVPISSVAGSITLQPRMAVAPVAAYGASKAALNLLVTRIHVEHTNLTAFIIHPGHLAYIPSLKHLMASTCVERTDTVQPVTHSPRQARGVCCEFRSCAVGWGQLWRPSCWHGAGAHYDSG